MNTPNPFNTQTNAQEQINKSRARLRFIIFAAFGVSLLVLVPLLVQGCKRQEEAPAPEAEAVESGMESNLPADLSSTNLVLPPLAPAPTNTITPPSFGVSPVGGATVETAVPSASGTTEYTVLKGDSFYTIGKKFGVSIKMMQEANPGVDSTKLKIGQKLNVPSAAAHENVMVAGAMEAAGSHPVHIVKSGDTLLRIAKQYGTSVKAIKSANNLATDRIKVGQKLKIPMKEVSPAIAPAVEPVPTLPPPDASSSTVSPPMLPPPPTQ